MYDEVVKIVADEQAIRQIALEEAADLLMDHGVIRSGIELLEVCQQIKDLANKPGVCVVKAGEALRKRASVKVNAVHFEDNSTMKVATEVIRRFKAFGIHAHYNSMVSGHVQILEKNASVTHGYDALTDTFNYTVEWDA